MSHPSPVQIRAAREAARLTQTQAAASIYSTLRTWQDWEAGIARMHPGLWELFQIKTAGAARPTIRAPKDSATAPAAAGRALPGAGDRR
jgi:putative transcriptional regulator